MFLYLIRFESNLFYIIYTDLQFIFYKIKIKNYFKKQFIQKKFIFKFLKSIFKITYNRKLKYLWMN